MVEAKNNLKYWDDKKPPLLISGAPFQFTDTLAPVIEDTKKITTEVNRGVVIFLDYQSLNRSSLATGVLETSFNSSEITCIAGGREILVNEPAERYDYAIDLGDRSEHKIPVRINGGQQITSTIKLPDLVSNEASQTMYTQLLLHYSTKRHSEWVKKYSKFGNGLGLKRRSYRLLIPNGSAIDKYNLEGVIPKNQGKIIGFSFLYEGITPQTSFINFSVDDLGLIKNVLAMRWSRLNQRDPYIQWIELNPGSTFKLQVDLTQAATTAINCYVTLYFDN